MDPLAKPSRPVMFAARYKAVRRQPGLRNFEPKDEYMQLGFADELEELKVLLAKDSDTMSPELR